jgi:hypothetical protein
VLFFGLSVHIYIQLFWPRVVVRKLLNISSKECDYSADSDDDNASDSASDINGNTKIPHSLNEKRTACLSVF